MIDKAVLFNRIHDDVADIRIAAQPRQGRGNDRDLPVVGLRVGRLHSIYQAPEDFAKGSLTSDLPPTDHDKVVFEEKGVLPLPAAHSPKDSFFVALSFLPGLLLVLWIFGIPTDKFSAVPTEIGHPQTRRL
jgi:hypothetical protein